MTVNDLIQYAFGALFAVIAMPLIFSRLEDHEHPDEVRAAPEREEVGA